MAPLKSTAYLHHLAAVLLIVTVLFHPGSGTPFRPSALPAENVLSSGSCRVGNLCCTGRDRNCAVSLNPGGPVSLIGNIITAAENSAKECYCDSACITLGDCCADYKATCGGKYPTERLVVFLLNCATD